MIFLQTAYSLVQVPPLPPKKPGPVIGNKLIHSKSPKGFGLDILS
jgi:hypothetical protein